MYGLPTSVTVRDREFHITNDGDFRMVLDCFCALNDAELSEDLRVLASLLIFYNEFEELADLPQDEEILKELCKAMYRFFNCGQDEAPGAVTNEPVIDWEQDSTIVCAAINNVAHQEVRALPYLHWWTFMGYYMSVGESVLSTVVSIRSKVQKHKKLEKWEQEFRKDNPQYFIRKTTTVSQKDANDLLAQMWNK